MIGAFFSNKQSPGDDEESPSAVSRKLRCVYISSAGWTVSKWFVLISLSVHEISLGFIRLLTLLTEKKETVEKVTLPHGLLRS